MPESKILDKVEVTVELDKQMVEWFQKKFGTMQQPICTLLGKYMMDQMTLPMRHIQESLELLLKREVGLHEGARMCGMPLHRYMQYAEAAGYEYEVADPSADTDVRISKRLGY